MLYAERSEKTHLISQQQSNHQLPTKNNSNNNELTFRFEKTHR